MRSSDRVLAAPSCTCTGTASERSGATGISKPSIGSFDTIDTGPETRPFTGLSPSVRASEPATGAPKPFMKTTGTPWAICFSTQARKRPGCWVK
ncbi:hypothetical protein D3C86_1277300 [compost metagenome]